MKRKILIVMTLLVLIVGGYFGYQRYLEHLYQTFIESVEQGITGNQLSDVKELLASNTFTIRDEDINGLLDHLIELGVNSKFITEPSFLHNYYGLLQANLDETMKEKMSNAIFEKLLGSSDSDQLTKSLANEIFNEASIKALVFREDHQTKLFSQISQIGNQSVLVLHDYLEANNLYAKSDLVEDVLLEYKVMVEARESFFTPFSHQYKDSQIANLARNDYFEGEFLNVLKFEDILYFSDRLPKWTYDKHEELISTPLKGIAIGYDYYELDELGEDDKIKYLRNFNQLLDHYYEVQIASACTIFENRIDIIKTDLGDYSDFEPYSIRNPFYKGEKTVLYAKDMTLIMENDMPWSFMKGYPNEPMDLYGIIMAGKFYHISDASDLMLGRAESLYQSALDKCDKLKMMGMFMIGNPTVLHPIPLSGLRTWGDWKDYVDENVHSEDVLYQISDSYYAVRNSKDYRQYKFGSYYGNIYSGKYQEGTVYGTGVKDDSFVYLDTYSFQLNEPILAHREKIANLFDHQIVSRNISSIKRYIMSKIYYQLNGSYDNHTAAKALESGLGVCESYAGLYNQMLNYLGIENYYLLVYSPYNTTGSHAYNVVLNNGTRTFTDLTWADAETYIKETYLSFSLSEHEYKPYQLPLLKQLIGDY